MMCPKKARDQEIVDFYLQPNSILNTGKKFGLSHEGVRLILIRVRPDVIRPKGLNLTKKPRVKNALSPYKRTTKRAAKLVEAGLSYGEAAKKLGITRSAVAGAVYRTRRAS